jgi:hypothetical protein
MENNLVLLSTTYIYKPQVVAPLQTYRCSSNAFALQQSDLMYNRYMTANINGAAHFTRDYSPCIYPMSLFEKESNYFDDRNKHTGNLSYTLYEEGRRVCSKIN